MRVRFLRASSRLRAMPPVICPSHCGSNSPTITNSISNIRVQKTLIIESPKLKRRIGSQWDDCFPYYAGFPESFASRIIETASLSSKKAVIFDPWNGSGTTTYAAAKLGYNSHGMDLNPVMVLVARARALYPTEAGSIEPQAKSLIKGIGALKSNIEPSDPLLQWFTFSTASTIRNLERRIRNRLVSADTRRASFDFEEISCFAATFYISLFSICRAFAKPFRSTNPTWLKNTQRFSQKNIFECLRDSDCICRSGKKHGHRASIYRLFKRCIGKNRNISWQHHDFASQKFCGPDNNITALLHSNRLYRSNKN